MANSLGLHEVFQQLLSLAYGIWRKRWYMLSTAWLISVLGWGFVSTMPYKYTSSAQVFVDTETILPAIAKNMGISIDVMRQVDVVRRTLVTRPNLEKIVRRSDYLDRFAKTDKQMDEMVSYLQKYIRVTSLQGGMFRIEFEIDDGRLSDRQRAEVSRTVVTNLLSFFMERNTAEGQVRSESATEFLDKQITEYEDRLKKAEAAHAQFRQDNIEYLGGQGNFLSRLESAKDDLRGTNSELSELQATIAELQRQLESVPPTIREARSSGLGGRGERDPLEERIAELQKKYDDLKALGMKELHPDVQSVKRQIDTLQKELEDKRKQVEAELADSASAGKSSSLTTETPNRLYEQLMLDIFNKRAEVATLERRASQQQSVVNDMESKAKRVPEIEAEEQSLKRGYRTIRDQYTEFLEQRQDLELKDQVESVGADAAFRVVEPPVTPQFPSGPPRLLFLTSVLIGALVVGLGVALIISQLRPVVITVEQLRSSFDLQVLGNVTKVMSEEDNKQRSMELLIFGLMGGGLILTYIGFVALDIFGAPSIGG